VDKAEVSSNFDALGDGVFRILTSDAETFSDRAQDAAFWDFVAAMRTEMDALRAFNSALLAAFNAWNPAVPATTTVFRNTVAALTVPSTTPNAPTKLNGRIR
jgi:hypothetical protein